jgi:hypothetical protein
MMEALRRICGCAILRSVNKNLNAFAYSYYRRFVDSSLPSGGERT